MTPKHHEEVLLDWIGDVCPTLGRHRRQSHARIWISTSRPASATRGECLCVSAYVSEVGLVLGQQRCDEKSNEITAIEALLPNLALSGCIVTIDTIVCQTEIATQIIAGKGDYLLNAKDNQPKLAKAIEEFIGIGEQFAWKNLALSPFKTLDKGHRQVETRRCVALPVLDYIPEITRWPGIKR